MLHPEQTAETVPLSQQYLDLSAASERSAVPTF